MGDLLGQPDAAGFGPPKESEFLGESGLSVTGKARMGKPRMGQMQLARVKMSQFVAQSATPDAGGLLSIKSHRPWRGVLNPRWVRNWLHFATSCHTALFGSGPSDAWPMTSKLIICLDFIRLFAPDFLPLIGRID